VDSVRGLLLLGELVVPLRLVQQACQGAGAVAADDVVRGAVADHQDLGGADAPDVADVEEGRGAGLVGRELAAEGGAERRQAEAGVEEVDGVLDVARDEAARDAVRVQERAHLPRARHDLQLLVGALLDLGDDPVRLHLLLRAPAGDLVQDVDRGVAHHARVVVAQHLPVHEPEVDARHRECAVHVEHHPLQRPPGLRAPRRRRHSHHCPRHVRPHQPHRALHNTALSPTHLIQPPQNNPLQTGQHSLHQESNIQTTTRAESSSPTCNNKQSNPIGIEKTETLQFGIQPKPEQESDAKSVS
jgi:hypothetical protein